MIISDTKLDLILQRLPLPYEIGPPDDRALLSMPLTDIQKKAEYPENITRKELI